MFQTQQLVIIGGPSKVGKSYLIARMQRGEYPHLCRQLGISEPLSWRFTGANRISQIREPILERLVLHQDIYGLYNSDKSCKNLREIIDQAVSCVTLTLYASIATLVSRLRIFTWSKMIRHWLRMRDPIGDILRLPATLRIQSAKRKVYSNQTRLAELYDNWFKIILASPDARHFQLDTSGSIAPEAKPLAINDLLAEVVKAPLRQTQVRSG